METNKTKELTIAKASQDFSGRWFIYIYCGTRKIVQLLGETQKEVESHALQFTTAPELLADLIELVAAEKASRDAFDGKSIARIEAALIRAATSIAKAEGRA